MSTDSDVPINGRLRCITHHGLQNSSIYWLKIYEILEPNTQDCLWVSFVACFEKIKNPSVSLMSPSICLQEQAVEHKGLFW
jgi:hypothetical protein